MYAEALALEMLTDRDIEFALVATGSTPGPRLEPVVRSARQDAGLLSALLDDQRLGPAVAGDPEILLKISPYLYFAALLRLSRRELGHRSFTAEWLAPRRRVPVFDARQVAEVLSEGQVLHYLADLLASFTAVGRTRPPSSVTQRLAERGTARRGRAWDLDLRQLHLWRERADARDHFALDRRLGDVALFLAGVFPDSAHGPAELDEWEAESENRYRQAARDPRARQCGLEGVLARLAGEVHPVRKALNFLADRHLQPLRCAWFPVRAS